jgi:hypothetical protein
MNPKYEIGQQVTVRLEEQAVSPRDSTLAQYAEKMGQVKNYYWISPRAGEIFYIYTVRFPDFNREIVLHEDEIRAFIVHKSALRKTK